MEAGTHGSAGLNDERYNESDGDRLLDLLSEHAASGLDADERAELEALLVGRDDMDVDTFDASAGALAEVFANASFEPMPAHIRERCIGAARVVVQEQPQKTSNDPAPGESGRTLRFDSLATSNSSPWSSAGWVAAAACLLLAVLAWVIAPGTPGVSIEPDPWINVTDNQTLLASQRSEFVETQAGRVIWEWSEWGDEYAGVTGDVVWDPETNEGFMRFRNLPPNDPQEKKYQLWIVDSTRGTPLQVPPVDGGLFDVRPTEDGEWIVPFTAKLPVGEATGFGVTLEDARGVVVSDQEVKAVIATAPPGES